MGAAQLFNKIYRVESLNQLYYDKVQHRASVGMDNISQKKFEKYLAENIEVIHNKVLSGTYHFTRYREVLISKGRNKAPRVISIPTVRDKLALAAYHLFLREVFCDTIKQPLLHSTIGDIAQSALSGVFNGYVKVDITKFYASINHEVLLKKIRKKIRKREALAFLENAITTETIPKNIRVVKRKSNTKGIPEGLSISNILADIYLADLQDIITKKYEVDYFRYVDDILILCNFEQAEEIKNYVIDTLRNQYDLSANLEKTISGELKTGVPFLGYVFYDNQISVREEAKLKIENSLVELFHKRESGAISNELFVWRLNLRITGCILEHKKYGWLFYYSQLNDLRVLYHLDWLVNRLFVRFKLKKTEAIKSFVRAYHEIIKNVSSSTYLINVDLYTLENKQTILRKICGDIDINAMTEEQIERLFRETMFREVQSLERDIQNFS